MLKKLNMKSMMKKLFTQVDNVVMDVQSGGLAIEHKDDVFSLGADNSITSGALFSMPVPAFATKINVDQIKVGDILVHNDKAHGFVIKVNGSSNSLRVITTSGATSTMHIKNDLLTGSGWMIVKSMFGNLGDNSMLPMLMMSSMGQDSDSEDSTDMMYPMLMMSMMGQNGTTGAQGGMQNMMLPLMMMSQGGKGGDMSSMLPLMMMSGGMNFAQPTQPAKTALAKKRKNAKAI